jgi:two-component system nitrate/nitrite response regulator NarL
VTTAIRVLLVDDHAVVREGIRHVLAGSGEFEVVGEASDGREALALARSLKPDVILLDISMPGDSGLDVVGALLAAVPSARVLMLSVYDQTEYVVQSVRAGAHGYLRKDTTPADLREAIRAVHRGDAFFSPVAARHLSDALREEAAAPRRDPLTAREREVLQGVAAGKTNKEIAADLGISVRTVEAHRDSLMRKLRIHTVAGLTRYAIEQNLHQE